MILALYQTVQFSCCLYYDNFVCFTLNDVITCILMLSSVSRQTCTFPRSDNLSRLNHKTPILPANPNTSGSPILAVHKPTENTFTTSLECSRDGSKYVHIDSRILCLSTLTFEWTSDIPPCGTYMRSFCAMFAPRTASFEILLC